MSWTSVKDKFPDCSGEYLVYAQPKCFECDSNIVHGKRLCWKSSYYGMASYDKEDPEFGWFNCRFTETEITHWTTLPMAPL